MAGLGAPDSNRFSRGLWVAAMAISALGTMTLVESAVTGHTVWPWEFAVEINSDPNYAANFVRSLLDRKLLVHFRMAVASRRVATAASAARLGRSDGLHGVCRLGAERLQWSRARHLRQGNLRHSWPASQPLRGGPPVPTCRRLDTGITRT